MYAPMYAPSYAPPPQNNPKCTFGKSDMLQNSWSVYFLETKATAGWQYTITMAVGAFGRPRPGHNASAVIAEIQ